MANAQNLYYDLGVLDIDFQRDFIADKDGKPLTQRYNSQQFQASLPVPGGKEAATNAARTLVEMGSRPDCYVETADEHPFYHASFAPSWKTGDGASVGPFTVVSARDIAEGRYLLRHKADRPAMLDIVRKMNAAGIDLRLWPAHCIDGSWGAGREDNIDDAVRLWEMKTGRKRHHFGKGKKSLFEQFSGVSAVIQDPAVPETLPNEKLLNLIGRCKRLIVYGLALDYCVAATARGLIREKGEAFAKRLIFFTDCTAAIDQKAGEAFLEEMRVLGATVITSKEFLN